MDEMAYPVWLADRKRGMILKLYVVKKTERTYWTDDGCRRPKERFHERFFDTFAEAKAWLVSWNRLMLARVQEELDMVEGIPDDTELP